MGNHISEMKPGDEVVIGEKNERVIQQMQLNHGGWNEGMTECMVGPCKLIQGIGLDAVVKAPSGSVYRLNSQLLVRYTKSLSTKAGDTVELIKDETTIKQLQEGHGGWNDTMKEMAGKTVEVVTKLQDGDVKIRYNNSTWTINPKCIVSNEETAPAGPFIPKEGDTVKLIGSLGTIKDLQEQHGGWSDLMTLLVGSEVQVVKIFEDGDMYVSKYGMEWLINPQCIEDPNKAKTKVAGKLRKGDIVLITSDIERTKELQQFHGGWISAMKLFAGKTGKVDSILPTGDVKVNVNGMSFVYNPALLSKTGDPVPTKSFSPGDRVKVIKDKETVKRLQKGHGEWIESMKLFLGEKGKVKSLFPDGDLRVKIMGNKITLNPECVEKIDSDNDSDSDTPDLMKMMKQMSKLISVDSDNSDKSEHNSDNESKTKLSSEAKAFFVAVHTGDLTKVRNLVDSVGVDKTKDKIYPLMIATSEGHEEVAKFLIEKKASINATDGDGDTALHVAVQKNRLDLCSLLIDNKANINVQNKAKMSPIMLAAQAGSLDILRLLVRVPGADLDLGDKDKDTALHLAIQKSRLDSVEILLAAGANLKALNEKLFNPYHMAALRGHEKILELFLKKEGAAIVDSQKEDKFAALHLVALNNHPGCMRLLIQHHADINIRNSKLQTPLHIAVSQKYIECVKILVEKKAELNLKDESGDTPIHDGIRIHNMEKLKKMTSMFGMPDIIGLMGGIQIGSDDPEEIVLFLARKGAKLDIKNNAGKTALDACEDALLKKKLLDIRMGNRPIEQPPTPLVQEVVPPQVEKSINEQIEEMRLIIQKMEDEKTCIICRDRMMNITFLCGHRCCDVCSNNLFECHICRKPIEDRIRIFD